MEIFECDDVGPLEEYVRCKIEADQKTETVKFMQLVLLQNFKNEFNFLGGKISNSGSVLTKGNMKAKRSNKISIRS